MSQIVKIDWNPDDKKLRQFSYILLAIAALFVWKHWDDKNIAYTLMALSLLAVALGVLLPKALKPVWIALSCITYPIGRVVSFVILIVIYYGVFTPAGFVLRLFSHDPLLFRKDQKKESYWVPHKMPEDAKRYFRQF